MAVTKVPANQYRLEILTAPSTYTEVKGLTTLDISYTATDVDGSTFDGDGWSEDYTVRRAASVSVQGRTLFDEATGGYDAGQAACNALAYQFGADAIGEFRMVFPGGGHGVTFSATVSNSKPYGGSKDDLANFSVELKIQGAPAVVTIP